MTAYLLGLMMAVCGAGKPDAAEGALPSMDAEVIERQAFRTRAALRRGDVLLELRSKQGNLSQKVTYRLVFDGTRARIAKRVFTGRGTSTLVDSSIVIYDGGDLIEWVDMLSADGRTFAVIYEHEAAIRDRRQKALRRRGVFDPRLLGIVPVSIHEFPYRSLDDPRWMYFTVNEREISHEVIDAMDTWRVRLVTPEATGDFWVAPAMGHSLVRAEIMVTGLGNLPFRDLFESTPKKADLPEGDDAMKECWYPATCRWRQYFGDVLAIEQVITVKSASFNMPVAPDTFSLKSMGIPAGTEVIEHPRNASGSRMWDGSKLVSAPGP